jgi:glycosyltransferase involved in cell wall biosynthesis
MRSEVIYINGGSRDSTLDIMRSLKSKDERVAILDLSRNFGKEIALTAGIDHTQGDAIVVIDADLQDPPELITKMVEHWKEGYDTVYAKRIKRDGESALKKLTSFLFYRLMQSIGRVQIPEDTGDFRILSRRAVDALKELREQHRFMKGLFTWIGFSQKAIPYERDPRYAGETKWNYWRLWNLALEGITSFTTVPLSYATYTGFITAFFSMLYGFYMIVRTVIFGNPVPGYPSLMVTVLFLGGVQLFAIGIVGEYLGRVFNETKGRPLYFVNEYTPAYGLKNSNNFSPTSSNQPVNISSE